MTDPVPGKEAYYATFPRRLNALSLDILILIGISIIVFALTPAGEAHPLLRLLLAIGWWGALVLYEPILVAFLGGTVGHRLMNLRVVDERTAGNLSLPKAVGRLFIKGILGLISFFTMIFSSKHQALHDMMTNSTVQIRDPAKALRHHYVTERPTGPPSPPAA